MKCQQCSSEVNPVGGVFIGNTELRVPVIEAKCGNGHPARFQLQAIRNMELPKAEKFPAGPGHWQGGKTENINLTCPICRGNFGLGIGKGPHSIDGEGAITPSMVCPYGCGWHTYVTLKGYKEAPTDD